MLFRRPFLDGIAAGSIDLAFRRWDRPRVKKGTRLRTAVGLVEIDSVTTIERDDIGEEDALRAGFASRDRLVAELDRRGRGTVHRVQLHWAGDDPRVALRGQADLTEDELATLRERLERLDSASRHGAWTHQTLELIRDKPAVRAADLAEGIGREKLPFKRDVRKLKELGLTESLETGYRLSPRGRALLERLEDARATRLNLTGP